MHLTLNDLEKDTCHAGLKTQLPPIELTNRLMPWNGATARLTDGAKYFYRGEVYLISGKTVGLHSYTRLARVFGLLLSGKRQVNVKIVITMKKPRCGGM